ncbi:transporter substrate-binding domain-containing protein [Nonomuraea sp. K274]|uniref:Transporter substrate-binding domain-containing protein n=1 Tax=Nonomuraea cypriaca TaxID=1187855 RepID=A0A931ADH8_9ACTN|nr:transporter substrate-binding domain-containing protein [Nonomuraea cypriaca]MBF8188523.1 transporter substrate-binding domain-containing protein [Nonomuraea cypriaca]
MVRVGQKAVIMVAFLLLAPACGSNSPPPQQQPAFPKKNLYIGVTPDHPGFSTSEPGTSRRTGFDIDLAKWLGSRLDKEVVFVDLTLADREEALKTSKVDMVISTFSINDARRDVIDFAGPYMITRQGVMVRKGDDRIKNFEDLTTNNRNICVPSGTTSQEQLQHLNGKSLTLTDETAQKDCLRKLVDKEVGAFSTDELILRGFAKTAPETQVIDVSFGLQEQYGIGLPNNDKAKCKVITEQLDTFINEGPWEDVLNRNLKLEKPDEFKPPKLDPCE